MAYKIFMTIDAAEELKKIIQYLIEKKRNPQAATSLLNDFENTKKKLEDVAGSLQLCRNKKLRDLGYRRINFAGDKYFMLYRIVDNLVYIDGIFHDLQDYENKIY